MHLNRRPSTNRLSFSLCTPSTPLLFSPPLSFFLVLLYLALFSRTKYTKCCMASEVCRGPIPLIALSSGLVLLAAYNLASSSPSLPTTSNARTGQDLWHEEQKGCQGAEIHCAGPHAGWRPRWPYQGTFVVVACRAADKRGENGQGGEQGRGDEERRKEQGKGSRKRRGENGQEGRTDEERRKEQGKGMPAENEGQPRTKDNRGQQLRGERSNLKAEESC